MEFRFHEAFFYLFVLFTKRNYITRLGLAKKIIKYVYE